MDWILVVILQVMFQPSLSGLLTVEAEQTTYRSEFGGDVVMSCRFQPKLLNPQDYRKVIWYWISSTSAREVYRMDSGVERLTSQDPVYQGRVRLLTDELKEGWVRLQVSSLRIQDSGTYQCLVHTGEGADFKEVALSVEAPYKTVTKHIQKTADGHELLLTCQSEGHPESSVTWQNGLLLTLNSSATSGSTPNRLFKVTSQIRVPSRDKNNYTCTFINDGYSAVFHIPDDVPIIPQVNDAAVIVLSTGLTLTAIIVTLILCSCRKGPGVHMTRKFLGGCRDVTASSTDCLQGNLRASVKDS
ncbi:programmed cell death 1 ligand 1-like [Brachionichthys hirsutus]|uniref:programmed cell death 1 ligand 1-like n=1 Tax=Brachionichthys hirsutus TaxID=412623 RepID=UPI003604DE15